MKLMGRLQMMYLKPILKHGLLKERFSAIVTDALRAEYLEREGYEVQVLEFIDMEHTPKNILIRAIDTGKKERIVRESRIVKHFLNVEPTLTSPWYAEGLDKRGHRMNIKNKLKEAGILIGVFIVAVLVFSYLTNKGNDNMTADIGTATFPKIGFDCGGYGINAVPGYAQSWIFRRFATRSHQSYPET